MKPVKRSSIYGKGARTRLASEKEERRTLAIVLVIALGFGMLCQVTAAYYGL